MHKIYDYKWIISPRLIFNTDYNMWISTYLAKNLKSNFHVNKISKKIFYNFILMWLTS